MKIRIREFFKAAKKIAEKNAPALAGTVALVGEVTSDLYSSTNQFIINIIEIALPVLITLAFVRMLFRNLRD